MYGKLNKVTSFDPSAWRSAGGDNEPLYLLLKLAERNPDVEWVVGTRYKGGGNGLPANVTLPEQPTGRTAAEKGESHTKIIWPYFQSADGVVMWLAKHGEANRPDVPQLRDRSKATATMDEFAAKVAPVLSCINGWRESDPLGREEIWLCPDTRFPLKARDLKWPPRQSILSQYPRREMRYHERRGDTRSPEECGFPEARWSKYEGVWEAPHVYTVDRLEVVGMPPEWKPTVRWERRVRFRVLTNETQGDVDLDKASIFRKWLPGLDAATVRGKWKPEGARRAGMDPPVPLPYAEIPDFLGGAKSTFVTPTSGAGWPTLKMHEAFALGTICFFHPKADDRGTLIPTADQFSSVEDDELKRLAEWLRPETPLALAERIASVDQDRTLYEWLRDAQLRLHRRVVGEERAVRTIEARLRLSPAC